MITSRLMGGIGNQLFQYAAGFALASRLGVPLQLDRSWFGDRNARAYRLDAFSITAHAATEEPIDLTVNVPALIVEQIIPVTAMVGLPILLSIVAWRIGWAKTRRDHMILQFSGFIAVYFLLTTIGTAFRGKGMELFWPWENPPVIT